MLKAQFLSLWDGLLSPSLAATPVVVIAATNRPDAVDPAVLRRLPLSFQIDLPGLHAREEVMLPQAYSRTHPCHHLPQEL